MEKLNSSKILVFGLPGSGKTTFARQLAVNMAYFNADEIRKMFNDWDFSMEGRFRQAERMYCLANLADGPAVVDFICPYDQNRMFRSKPVHDWSSHACDSMRYLAVGLQEINDRQIAPQSVADNEYRIL